MDAAFLDGALSVQLNTGNGKGALGSTKGITNTKTTTAADVL